MARPSGSRTWIVGGLGAAPMAPYTCGRGDALSVSTLRSGTTVTCTICPSQVTVVPERKVETDSASPRPHVCGAIGAVYMRPRRCAVGLDLALGHHGHLHDLSVA